jgi:hypothetical protein
MQVYLDELQFEVMEEYASATGQTLAACLYDAVDTWIRTVAVTITQNEPMNVIGFPERLSR